jgi:hypothetical protein
MGAEDTTVMVDSWADVVAVVSKGYSTEKVTAGANDEGVPV